MLNYTSCLRIGFSIHFRMIQKNLATFILTTINCTFTKKKKIKSKLKKMTQIDTEFQTHSVTIWTARTIFFIRKKPERNLLCTSLIISLYVSICLSFALVRLHSSQNRNDGPKSNSRWSDARSKLATHPSRRSLIPTPTLGRGVPYKPLPRHCSTSGGWMCWIGIYLYTPHIPNEQERERISHYPVPICLV